MINNNQLLNLIKTINNKKTNSNDNNIISNFYNKDEIDEFLFQMNNNIHQLSNNINVLSTDMAPLESPNFTGNVSGITKEMINLNNIDNTSDFDKPLSNSISNELNLYAKLESPSFTGNVNGIDANMVGTYNKKEIDDKLNNNSNNNSIVFGKPQNLNLVQDMNLIKFSIDIDNNNIYNKINDEITITDEGYYYLNIILSISNDTDIKLYLIKNDITKVLISGTNNNLIHCNFIHKFNKNDIIKLFLDRNIEINYDYSSFCFNKL